VKREKIFLTLTFLTFASILLGPLSRRRDVISLLPALADMIRDVFPN
jgi:hypothetical protein